MFSIEKIIEGEVILINKPLRWTSFDVVNKIRIMLRQLTVGNLQSAKKNEKAIARNLKVGHAGTLDPLATGLLIICTGKMTKEVDEIQQQEKEYTGTITLGRATPSFDLETESNDTFPTEHITEEMIRGTTKKFIGTIQQRPPVYSAVKIAGERAYNLARAGKTVEMKSKEVNIASFEITKIVMPIIEFKVVCSKGTYIRSLADDFGKALNSGAHLSSLRRTRIGNFRLENALSIEDFGKKTGWNLLQATAHIFVSNKNFH